MKLEVFYAPGEGASDSLMDWLERQEIIFVARNVKVDADSLFEGLALGCGRWPVLRKGARRVVGLDWEAIGEMLAPIELVGGGVAIELANDGHPVVLEVAEGSAYERCGLHVGDVIATVGGYSTVSIEQLRVVFSRQDRCFDFEVRRDGHLQRLTLVPVDS